MKSFKLIAVAILGFAFSATASAQLGTGGGSPIPAAGGGSGGGGSYPSLLPPFPAVSTAAVATPVSSISSIEIDGFVHSWVGDIQATLTSPDGVEHLIFLRPGYANTSLAGSNDNLNGNYVLVESGGLSLPTMNGTDVDIPAGTYNQTFDSGGDIWVSGTNGIVNTPMSAIGSATAGDWTLTLYDWAGGDTGAFAAWRLYGTPGSGSSGSAYCLGDGTGAACPCGNLGTTGQGCSNSSGGGATLTASGNAGSGAGDTLVFDITGVNGAKAGLMLRGDNQISSPVGAGLLCVGANTLRSQVQVTDASGATTYTNWNGAGFSSVANAGAPTNFQFWYRDPMGSPCASTDFNFSSAWTVTYP